MAVFDTLFEMAKRFDDSIFILIGVFIRVSIVFQFAPGISERFFPIRIRLVASLVITLVVFSAIAGEIEYAVGTISHFVPIIFAEGFAGFVFGFMLRGLIFALQITGAMIAQHLSLSQLFGPSIVNESESPFGSILTFSGICLVVSAGFHYQITAGFIATYDWMPFASVPNVSAIAEWSANHVGSMIKLAFQLASPFIALSVIYTMALAASSRAMPQLSAAFVGAPAITIAGLILFAIAAPILLELWIGVFEDTLNTTLDGTR